MLARYLFLTVADVTINPQLDVNYACTEIEIILTIQSHQSELRSMY